MPVSDTSRGFGRKYDLAVTRLAQAQLVKLGQRDLTLDLARVEHASTGHQRAGGAAGHGVTQCLFGRAVAPPRCEVASQQCVTGTDGADDVDARNGDTQTPLLTVLAEQQHRAGLVRNQHVARPHIGDLIKRIDQIGIGRELVADEFLGLQLIRCDEVGLGGDGTA